VRLIISSPPVNLLSRQWDPQQFTNLYGVRFTVLYVDGVCTSQETHLLTSSTCYGDGFTFLCVDHVHTCYRDEFNF
jgi:hypothetical protein